MREILFRGKRTDNGEWVEGSFLLDGEAHRPVDKEHISFSKCYIVPETDLDNIKTRFNDGSHFLQTVGLHVIHETVGQFTGLTDKKGKKIFEGDIIRAFGETYACRWDDGNYEFGLSNKHEGFGIAYVAPHDMEIIGNIHDNPELVEG